MMRLVPLEEGTLESLPCLSLSPPALRKDHVRTQPSSTKEESPQQTMTMIAP